MDKFLDFCFRQKEDEQRTKTMGFGGCFESREFKMAGMFKMPNPAKTKEYIVESIRLLV